MTAQTGPFFMVTVEVWESSVASLQLISVPLSVCHRQGL